MNFGKNLFICCLLFSSAFANVIKAPSASALTQEEIDSIASQTTVVIANGLAKGDIEARQEFDPGSGVIIGRKGKIYYALTNNHVVQEQDDGKIFGVRTADGEVHTVIDTNNNIIRLGSFIGDEAPIDGFDLAIVKFQSKNDYPVVTLGQSVGLQLGDSVHVSGWPKPADMSARRQRRLVSGSVALITNIPFSDGGYNLLYNNETKPGMSGGPVLNNDGELVGIHGRGRARSSIYCIDPQMSINNSCGIQAIHFITQAEAIGIHSALNSTPPTSDTIAKGRTNRQKADVIKDIYKIFTDLRSPLRDCPTGVLIDDFECDNGF